VSNEPAVHITKKGGVKLTVTLAAAASALYGAVQGGMWLANRQRDFAEVQVAVGTLKQDTQSLTMLYAKETLDAETLAALDSGARLVCSCVCKPEQPGRGGGSSTVPARAPGPAMSRPSGHPLP
jgi:hypothetical protein